MPGDPAQSIVVSRFDDLHIVSLRGEWDVSNRDRLRAAFEELGTQNDIVVDLRHASFFDSTALAELIGLYKRLSADGRRLEALVGGSNMRRLLELTSLDGLFGISDQRARYLTGALPPVPWPP